MIVKNAENQTPIGGFEELAGMITDFWETDDSLPPGNFSLCRPVHLRGSGCRMECKLQTADEMERIQNKLSQEDSENPFQIEEVLSWDPPGPVEEVMAILFSVRGGGDPVGDLANFCQLHDLVFIDCQTMETVDLEAPSRESYHKWQGFRDHLGE